MRAFQIVIDRRPQRAAPRPFPALQGVVDVLVDGTNVTARIGQDHALPLLRDLAYTASDLATGRQRRATVRFYDQRDAWAMGLERVEDDALLTVFRGGASPQVAVFERHIAGEALLRGLSQALGEVIESKDTPEEILSDLRAARQSLEVARWRPADQAWENVEVRVDGQSDAALALGVRFEMRADPGPSLCPEVERNDLHSLLFKGPLRIRVGEVRREVGETFPFLVAELLVREAAEVLQSWEAGRALHHRSEVAGIHLIVRLTSDGRLSLGLGGSRTGGVQGAPTFPTVGVPAFIEAVITFGRALTRPIVRNDPSQTQNLRMRLFREALRDLGDNLRQSVREDPKVNDSPESYRAFADATSSRSTHAPGWGAGRVRFAPAWQATVPGVDFASTLMFGDRLMVGGARELACIERGTGELLWRVPVERGVSIAAPDGVARVSPDGMLTLYDAADGQPLLSMRLAARTGSTPAGAVINAPGLPRLLVVSEGERHISAVDLVSGEVRWRHALGRGRFFKVRRAGRLLVVSSSESTLTAIDVASGDTVWRTRDRQRFCRPATYDNNQLFVVSGNMSATNPVPEVVHEIDPWTGVTRWQCGLPKGRRAVGVPLCATNVVVVPVHDERGTGFVGIDREQGTTLWEAVPGFAPTSAAWLVVDELLIVNGDNGEVAALELSSGRERWRQSFGRDCCTDVPRHLEPVLRSGGLFVPQQSVQVVRPDTGEVLGKVPCELVPDLIRVDDRCNVVVVEESGHLAAFNAGPRLSLVRV